MPYALTDTVLWESPGIGGYRAVLRRGTEIIDTVALHFGVHAVGRDSIVFLPIRTDPTDTITGPWQYLLGHVLYHRGARRALAPILPNFDPCFSQPSVIDSMLYYWGLRRTDGSIVRYAARFDFRRAHVDSIQLDSVEMATDNCYYLPEPIAADEGVVFEPYLVSRDFSSARIVEP